MPHTWHAVDLKSGRRGPKLDVQQRGTVSRIIGEATDAQLAVSCWDASIGGPVPDWRQSTQPGRVMLVLVDDDDRPIWGGVVLRRVLDAGPWATVTLATLEHYLDRRYSGTMTFNQVEQAVIAEQLIAATISSSGIPFVIDRKDTGVLRDRVYLDEEDKTTLSLLTDLLNLSSGVEFTVDLEWTDPTNTVLRRIIRIASRVGTALAQPIRFEMPGPVTGFTIIEDFTAQNGANDVLAVSSGEGDTRPQSAHAVDQAAIASGWVRYERRFTPSTSITEQATLDNYATADLARKRGGLLELSLVANLDACPRVNADWWLGDNITAVITSPSFPERVNSDGQQVPGYERTVRAVGWTIDLDARTLTPAVREVA